MSKVKPVPDGYHTVTPYLVARDAAGALAFYQKAFGAEESFRMPGPDGGVVHAEFRIGDSPLMLGEECPEQGAHSPKALNGSPVNIFLYVPDVDASFRRATQAGCTTLMPPTNMFWGDRFSKLQDPYGHLWSIATHVEDVAPEDMARRMAESMSK